jgi:hypothetical protein
VRSVTEDEDLSDPSCKADKANHYFDDVSAQSSDPKGQKRKLVTAHIRTITVIACIQLVAPHNSFLAACSR